MNHEPRMSDAQPEDFGRHNMVVLGVHHVFLSHLPMFGPPHDYQVLLEVTLGHDDDSLMARWAAERDAHPDVHLYTVAPEPFALTTLFRPDEPERRTFTGTIFRGHLERGGEPIPAFTEIIVSIVGVVFAEQFHGIARPDDLTYRLFGREDELFLAHVIRQPPDFDQLLPVGVRPTPSAAQIDGGLEVVFLGRPNRAGHRLAPGEEIVGRGHVTGAHQFLELDVGVLGETYFEEGELSSLDGSFEPTAEEREAGFGD